MEACAGKGPSNGGNSNKVTLVWERYRRPTWLGAESLKERHWAESREAPRESRAESGAIRAGGEAVTQSRVCVLAQWCSTPRPDKGGNPRVRLERGHMPDPLRKARLCLGGDGGHHCRIINKETV